MLTAEQKFDKFWGKILKKWYNFMKTSLMKKLTYLFLVFSLLFAFWALGTTATGILTSFLSSAQSPINERSLSGNFNPAQKVGIFHGQKVSVPALTPYYREVARILGLETGKKRIEIDLTNQRLYAFEGNRKIFDFLVSTGKWGRTPTGSFRIWVKLRYTPMQGGSRALRTYYYLPNVPFTMYFEGTTTRGEYIPRWRGYGVHGTYWHNNFGHPMSHGCINLRIEDAEKLYYWAKPLLGEALSIYANAKNPGTPIVIYGKAPKS